MLPKKDFESYQNLFEEKNGKHQYACEQYTNLSEGGEDKKHQYACK